MSHKDNKHLSNVEFAEILSKEYLQSTNIFEKKKIGQVLTPAKIANFMAKIIKLSTNDFKILDAGAGTGILFSAIFDRVKSEIEKPINIQLIVSENDPDILPSLKKCLVHCKKDLAENEHILEYFISEKDFIEENIDLLTGHSIHEPENSDYDIVISNPPYQKIKNSLDKKQKISKSFHGQSNSYVLFIDLCLKLLRPKGQFVFLSPRSYCSGPYHQKTRELLLNDNCIEHIHSFKSRKKIFLEFDILQEVIIVHGEKTPNLKCSPIQISISEDRTFSDQTTFCVPYHGVVPKKNPRENIHIPQDKTESKIVELVQSWDDTFESLSLKISTGKVVDFRSVMSLMEGNYESDTVPLLWMHHVENGRINWPIPGFRKPQFFLVTKSSKNKLIPLKNYVILRRFSAKEEKKRIYAAPFLIKDFSNFDYVGFENHLNYIYQEPKEFSQGDARGISAFLNSRTIDIYYRTLSGNTQVNASDILKMPMPPIEVIKKIGKLSDHRKIDSLLLGRDFELLSK